jgi:hypothetical protein
MAVGRPVIYIGPGGSEVAAVIREAKCGAVFETAESEKAASAIHDLAYEPWRREHLGAEGRRYFEATLDKKFAYERFRVFFEGIGRCSM